MVKDNPAPQDRGIEPLRILLIEDDPDARELVADRLRRDLAGLVLTEADDAESLRRSLDSDGLDLVISDHDLGWTTGLDVLRAVKARRADTPVILLSGSASEALMVEGLRAGLDDYIRKSGVHLERLCIAVRAVMERRQQRRRASDAEERCRRMFEGMPIALYRTTAAGEILEANAAMAALLGERDACGLKAGPMTRYWAHPGQGERFVELLEREGVVRGFELDVRRADGTTARVRSSARAVRDFDGRLVCYEGAFEDVTERIEKERALLASEERVRLLLDSAGEAIYGLDAAGTCTFANRACARLLGFATPEELMGRDMHGLVHHTRADGAPYPREECRIYAAFRVGEGVEVSDEVFWRADGTSFRCTYRSLPLRRGSDVIGAVVTFTDLTDQLKAEAALRETEEQLRQAQKLEALGRLAGGVAHDFNNLLTVMDVFSTMVRDGLAKDDPHRTEMDEVIGAARRAADLTRQLLAFGRRQVMQPQVLDLAIVLKDMDRLLRRLIGEDIELVTIVRPGAGRVLADPGQIEQVIANLVVNSRDAMPDGGRILMSLENVVLEGATRMPRTSLPPGHYVGLTVTDTGCGMDDATQAHLFEPFFTTKEKGRGTGLGLATVHGIVKQSGGDILVRSQPGRGATFTILLPRVGAECDPPSSSSEDAPLGTETVLVVEDDPAVRGVVREALTRAGYEVLDAGDCDAALGTCERHEGQVHLLVADVLLPGPAARTLVETLSAMRPGMRVLYMSGHAQETFERRGVVAASANFIAKPFSLDALLRKVRDVLDAPEPSAADEAAGR